MDYKNNNGPKGISLGTGMREGIGIDIQPHKFIASISKIIINKITGL